MLLSLIIAIALIPSLANASDCWKLKGDQKYWCESEIEGKRSCWRIKEKDLKNYCYSRFENKRNCWRIKEDGMRIMCEMQTGQ